MMKWALIVGLSIGMVVVNEQPAEAGFFRRGPIRRFLFGGGPVRRRMFARRMIRRGFCGNCIPRRAVPRCGAGVHGGRCGFGNPNFRDFRNQRNFQFFGDPLRSQFDPGLNPALNPFLNPNAAQFFPFQNGQPFNTGGGFTPVSAQVRESELEKIYNRAQEADLRDISSQAWAGFCEDRLGRKTEFRLPDIKRSNFREGALALDSETESFFVRAVDKSRLAVKTSGQDGIKFCLVEKQSTN